MIIRLLSCFKHFVFIVLLLIPYYSFSQAEKDTQETSPIIFKKNVHEINYQPLILFGYSYFHNFNNHVVPGLGLKIGYGFAYSVQFMNLGPDYSVNDELVQEILEIDFKFRDAFAKRKLTRWNSYDLGLSYTAFLHDDFDWANVLALEFIFNARVYKILHVGAFIKIGESFSKNEINLWFMLYPALIISL